MPLRRPLLALPLLAALLPGVAAAAQRQPFTDAAFEAAQAAGRPILIEVFAPWCPTCRAQRPHIDAVAADPRMAQAVLLTVDFDGQKPVLQRFGVRSQATLIAFRGTEERGRATGVTNPQAIRDLLFRAL